MRYKIKAGKHRPKWWWLKRLWSFRFIHSTRGKVRNIRFHESWRNSDPNAWHKLFGFSNGFAHHYTSFRFACRYDKSSDRMLIAVYAYISGQRYVEEIGSVKFNQATELKVSAVNNVFEGSYYAYEMDKRSRWKDCKPINRVYVPYRLSKFGWFLGLYHGGKKPAESEIITYSDKYL